MIKRQQTIFSLIIVLCLILGISGQAKYSYFNQSGWPGVCSTGQRQSPVDLDSASIQCASSPTQTTFNLNFFSNASFTLEFFPGAKNYEAVSSTNFGTLQATDINGIIQSYNGVQFHIHQLAEHAINGIRPKLELHFVFSLNPNPNISNQTSNTLGVVGVQFTTEPLPNQNASQFMNLFNSLYASDTSIAIDLNALLGALLNNGQNFIHYQGSLTTPPCTEAVNFYILETPLLISQDQMRFLDNTYIKNSTNYPPSGNARDLQNLNGRQLLKICNVQGIQAPPATPCTDTQYAVAINKLWILVCAAMIFSMQIGFAFLEAGSIRKKNYGYVFYKILLHCLFGVLGFWLFGYAFAFGNVQPLSMLGGAAYYAGDLWNTCEPFLNDVSNYAHWAFQYGIAAVVVDITNGSIAERTSLIATSIHCFLYTALIYPVVLAWTWGGGWLYTQGYVDFTGSGIVHCTGAFAGLAGLLLVGNRYNRYHKYDSIYSEEKNADLMNLKGTKSTALDRIPEEDGNLAHAVKDVGSIISVSNISRMRKRVDQNEYEYFEVTNLSYVMFGGLFLWLGFIFFNAGSSIGMYKNTYPLIWLHAEMSAVNTFMSGSSAGLWCLLLKTKIMGGWGASRHMIEEAASVCNAFLCGMVANGAGMNNYDPWAAWVVGLIGSSFYMILCKIFDLLGIDDAVEAFQLHGGGGMAGVLSMAFFNKVNGIYYNNPTQGRILGIQLLGLVVISAWTFACSLIIYGVCKFAKILRLDLKSEIMGYDFVEFADDFDFKDRILVPSSKKDGHDHPAHSNH